MGPTSPASVYQGASWGTNPYRWGSRSPTKPPSSYLGQSWIGSSFPPSLNTRPTEAQELLWASVSPAGSSCQIQSRAKRPMKPTDCCRPGCTQHF